jgi:hypothetical protein
MKIKISRNLIVWILLIFIMVSLIYTMVVLDKMRSDEANNVRPVPEGYTSPTVNINTTIFDPIIGNWILPNYKTGQTINITIDRYGFVTKWKRNNDNLTYVRGPWTKVSENSYRIR